MMKVSQAILLAAGLVGAVLTAPAAAQPSLAMLDTITRGMWELKFRDGQPPRRVCVRTGREFIRLQHPTGACNRFVVEDGKSSVTVQYTCKGDGYGRTAIRRENADLVQIDGQGIKGGRPFQFSAEGRRIGTCR